MPRRVRRYASRARSYVRSRSGGMFGGMQGKLMKVLAGGLGGVAAQAAGNFNAQWGPALGLGAVGYLMNNETLLTLAGMNLSRNVPVLGGGGGSSAGSGWV